MPYIKPEHRKVYDPFIHLLPVNKATPAGELNYLITKILLETQPTSYAEYNTLIGVLECCKLEFYRKAVAVYEEEKIKQNGAVYGFSN